MMEQLFDPLSGFSSEISELAQKIHKDLSGRMKLVGKDLSALTEAVVNELPEPEYSNLQTLIVSKYSPSFVLMEYVDFTTIQAVFRRPVPGHDRVKLPYKIGEQGLGALVWMKDRGLIHGDMSPKNVLIDPETLSSDNISIKIIDLDFAYSTTKMGTPWFTCPYMLAGREFNRSNVDSFGVANLMMVVAFEHGPLNLLFYRLCSKRGEEAKPRALHLINAFIAKNLDYRERLRDELVSWKPEGPEPWLCTHLRTETGLEESIPNKTNFDVRGGKDLWDLILHGLWHPSQRLGVVEMLARTKSQLEKYMLDEQGRSEVDYKNRVRKIFQKASLGTGSLFPNL